MRLAAILFTTAVCTSAALPQQTSCGSSECAFSVPVVLAVVEGQFEGSESFGPLEEIDRAAALEQQAWRLFEWKILVTGRYEARHVVEGKEDGTEAAFLVPQRSDDGERYERARNQYFQAGEYMAVLLMQRTKHPERDNVQYVPSYWKIEILGSAILSETGETLNPALVIVDNGNSLGCAVVGCGLPTNPRLSVYGLPSGEIRWEIEEGESAHPPTSINDSLASELQSELARLGCYSATVDGLWGPASLRAMAAFNAATGAALHSDAATPKALAAAAREREPVCSNP